MAHKNYDITNSVDTSALEDPKLNSVTLYVHNIRCRFPCLAFTLFFFARGLQNKFHVWTVIDSDFNQTFPFVKLQGVVSIANWPAHYRISNIKSPHEVTFILVFGSRVIPNRGSNQQGFWFTFLTKMKPRVNRSFDPHMNSTYLIQSCTGQSKYLLNLTREGMEQPPH